MKPDKSKMVDAQGKLITQGLFLETSYDTRYAVYTTKDWDHDYKGTVYPSLKRLYLEMEDVVEYDFANTYLRGWNHWQRLAANKALTPMIEEWRAELELKIRSQAFKDILDATADEKSFQASKYLLEKGWSKNARGRPTKKEKETESQMQRRIENDYASDLERFRSKAK